MPKPSSLPRGIKAVAWRNTTSGITSTRFRARLIRSGEKFQLDRLCETLDDAIALMNEASTLDGRRRIAAGRDCLSVRSQKQDIGKHLGSVDDDDMRASVKQATVAEVDHLAPNPTDAFRDAITQEIAKEMILKAANGRLTTLSHIVDRYIDAHLAEVAKPESIGKVRENIRTAAKLMKIRLENALRTPMLYLPHDKRPEYPLVGRLGEAYESRNSKRQTLGDWLMIELDAEVGEAYIRQRLKPFIDRQGNKKTRAPTTIKREIVDLNKVINDLRESDRGMWKAIGSENKFAPCARSIKRKTRAAVNSDGAKRWRRIDEDEEKLLLEYLTTGTVKIRRSAEEVADGMVKTQERKRNPELVLIFRLSVAMGLRASECVLLEWADIDLKKNTIYLHNDAAKRGERRPMITREAHQVLADIREHQTKNRIESLRLFRYTVQGFKGQFRKIRDASGIEDMVWHDLRRTAISRIWDNIPGAKPTEIAQWFGAQDVKHFKENMLVPIQQSKGNERGEFVDERHARQSVGHASESMTQFYVYHTAGRGSIDKSAATEAPPERPNYAFGSAASYVPKHLHHKPSTKK